MECTQRLECTQEAYETHSERICPEQIGFLGICGSKQPIKKGPNKIGRDPQTCAIILNDNSISRQHAVINILNKKDFMLMDLDSSNKTKLMGKTLQPYIPHPLKNGDTVQFGQVFGIFRLLEEDDELPMTQAMEIPDTPINIRHVSRLKTAPITTVPESPDVSDRDDSIIAQSQPKKNQFKSPNNNFIKSSDKIIGIQKTGTNKIDNVYWNSSKKSESFGSNCESNSSFTVHKSSIPPKLTTECSIYDMETQAPALPDIDKASDSIYEANTQVRTNHVSPNVYNCETQIPNKEKLPEVYKMLDQSNVQLNLYSTNEKFDIFEAETQVMLQGNDKEAATIHSSAIINDNHKRNAVSNMNKKLNSSDEEICFDDIDCAHFEHECGSQPLLSTDPCDFENLAVPITNPEKNENSIIEKNKTTNSAVLNVPVSKDCDEIAPSQMVPEKLKDDEDITDCEDNLMELAESTTDGPNKPHNDDDVTDCEHDLRNVKLNNKEKTTDDDDLTDCEDFVIEISQNKSKASSIYHNLDDCPTQVIGEENLDEGKKPESGKDDTPFEDMLTQVIEECPLQSIVNAHLVNNIDKSVPFEDLQTQVIDIVIPQDQSSTTPKQIENDSSFKRPLSSPKLKKRNAISLKRSIIATDVMNELNSQSKVEDDLNYYDATQQILNDLCTQGDQLDTLPCPKMVENDVCPKINTLVRDRSSEDSDATERINSFVSNLSKEQVQEVIGANTYVAPLSKKKSSDSSDLEITPKKFNPSKFLKIDLPNSQDIKSCDFVSSKRDASDSSDGFENTEEQDDTKDSPQIGPYRRKRKKSIKLDLMKKFDMNTLPTRAITRIRKPTSKLLDSDTTTKKMSEKILLSNLGLDKEHEIDGEILQLNLKRLRSKMEKAKSKNSSSNRKSIKDEKDAVSKYVQIIQNDKEQSKEYTISAQTNEKELKQQNIKTMLKGNSSNNGTATEACINMKTKSLDSSHKSRRSSRNKNKGDKKEEPVAKEVNAEFCERKKSGSRIRSSRKNVKETIDLTDDQETVIRRSRRHQTTKDKIENKESNKSEKKCTATTSELTRINSANNEYSAVYNLSSETGVDSPINLKRQATSDIFGSKTKKAKSSNAGNTLVRATPSRGIRTQHVLFTAFPCEEVKLKLEKLGAVIVSDVKACTVVLTLQIRRTFKLLCALGLGKPIVGPNWVQACADSNMIVDPWLYLMKDEATEKRFGFSLRQSLTCKRNFLKGYNVFCTPNVTPNAQEMKSIVECSGGTWKEGGRSWFCVSCPADKALWPGLRKRGATLVSTEFVLGGVLQQRINLDRDKLG